MMRDVEYHHALYMKGLNFVCVSVVLVFSNKCLVEYTLGCETTVQCG